MFEREIKFIYDFNLNKVKKTGSFLTYEQLLAADLHPAIMQYISAEIDYLIFEDRQKMLKNSVFDYSGGKITQYFNLISQEVKKSKRFSTEYISKLILHASSFTVNFLIRPKWSLLKFIYDEEEHKTSAEIKQILNYLYYYGYLKNILVSYLDKKKILSMNKEEFADLLDKIEKLGVETYLDDVLNTALKSMAEFFNIGTTQKTKVPLPGIYVFLKEKKLTDHINRLNNYFGDDEKINHELKDIQKVLGSVKTKQKDLFEEINEEEIEDEQPKLHEEVIETQEEFENETISSDEVENEEPVSVDEENEIENFEKENDSQTENNIEQEVAEEERIVDVSEQLTDETEKIENEEDEDDEQEFEPPQVNTTVQNEDEIETEQELQTIEEELEEKIEEDIAAEITEENENIADNPVEDNVDEETAQIVEDDDELEEDEPTLFGNEELQKEEEPEDKVIETQKPVTKTEEAGGSTFIDMSAILEHKNMTKIIENIFDYDMEDFANTIDMISECASKAEALAFINDLFESNNIKTNSKEAETFKSIISEYFDKA